MRLRSVSPAALVATALLFATLALLPSRRLAAQDSTPQDAPRPTPGPRFADHSPQLDASDEIAALEALGVALSEVGDGATFVWHRSNGRLSGVVQPTASFKDASGRVCRHIVLELSTGVRSGRVEGIACRLADGRWQLEG